MFVTDEGVVEARYKRRYAHKDSYQLISELCDFYFLFFSLIMDHKWHLKLAWKFARQSIRQGRDLRRSTPPLRNFRVHSMILVLIFGTCVRVEQKLYLEMERESSAFQYRISQLEDEMEQCA